MFWSVPVAIIAALVLLFAPRATNAVAARRRWWPDWNDPLIWRLGIMLGTVNAMYFGTNAFLPDYLTHIGHRELISAGDSKDVAFQVRRGNRTQNVAIRMLPESKHFTAALIRAKIGLTASAEEQGSQPAVQNVPKAHRHSFVAGR